MFEQTVRGFALATQRVNDEGESYLDVHPELMSEQDAKQQLAAMAAKDRHCSVLVPVVATVTDSDVYAAMVKFYEAKLRELAERGQGGHSID